jgi:2-dehydro-3-deoxyphosphogluconate aldolase / (4S)-4-hydroxy-2-oxoglutarate aldolase
MSPDQLLDTVQRYRAIAILRGQHQGRAAHAMDAAVAAGFRLVEFTVSTPGAYELIAEFARRPGVVVGAGTVLDLAALERAVGAGAKFLVSPVLDPQIMAAARERDVAILPGCYTPTELLQGHRAGAAALKLFPGPTDIARYVRAVLGPMPFLRIVPTNGVDASNAAEVLTAGAVGVGFTTSLFDSAEVEHRQLDRITARARTLLAAVKQFTIAGRRPA